MKKLIILTVFLLLFPVVSHADCTVVVGGVAASEEATTSYENEGGSGDRTASIVSSASSGFMSVGTEAGLINGTTDSGSDYFSTRAIDGNDFFRWDFGEGAEAVITEVKFYQSNTAAQGTYQFQGSANASDWTNIGDTFALGGATTRTITEMSGNTTGYRYYQILGVSGNNSDSPYTYEFEFKISGLD